MSTTNTKFSITFTTDDGESTLSFKYADPDVEAIGFQNAARAIIANGAIYSKVPISVKSMKLVTTTETPLAPPAQS